METTPLDAFSNLIVNVLRNLADLQYIRRALFAFKFARFMTHGRTFFSVRLTSRKLEIVTALCAVHFHRVLLISQKNVRKKKQKFAYILSWDTSFTIYIYF